MKKPNLTKVLGIGGTVLGLAASLIGSYASKKELDETVAKKVQEALQNQSK